MQCMSILFGYTNAHPPSTTSSFPFLHAYLCLYKEGCYADILVEIRTTIGRKSKQYRSGA